jgi:hypothetical protein
LTAALAAGLVLFAVIALLLIAGVPALMSEISEPASRGDIVPQLCWPPLALLVVLGLGTVYRVAPDRDLSHLGLSAGRHHRSEPSPPKHPELGNRGAGDDQVTPLALALGDRVRGLLGGVAIGFLLLRLLPALLFLILRRQQIVMRLTAAPCSPRFGPCSKLAGNTALIIGNGNLRS